MSTNPNKGYMSNNIVLFILEWIWCYMTIASDIFYTLADILKEHKSKASSKSF